MRWQRNMFQTKEQDKTPEEQLSEVEIGNLPMKEFQEMATKMIQELIKRTDAQIEKSQEVLNKDVEELKNKQKEMENKITEMKNTLEGINSRIAKAEECISELEDRMVKSLPWSRVKKKRMKRNEDSLRDLWENIKGTNKDPRTISKRESG